MTVRITDLNRPTRSTYERFKINSFHHDVVAQICDFIKSNLDGDLTVTRLAAKSGYSKSHFMKMFRMIHGMSIQQYVNNTRLDAAAALLRDTDLPVMKIQAKVGMTSGAFAKRFFTRHGYTPRLYRGYARAAAARRAAAQHRQESA